MSDASMEGLVCYVIEMKFKGHEKDESPFKPEFFKTYRGADVDNGWQIETGDITQAYRFETAGSAALTARGLLQNPAVCNSTPNSYEISIRQLQWGMAKRARLSETGDQVELY